MAASSVPGRLAPLARAAALRSAWLHATAAGRPGPTPGYLLSPSLSFRRSSMRMIWSRRGPCAPSSMRCSISPVRDGPVMKLIARGIAAMGSQSIPAILVGGNDLIRTHDDDMGVGQKIQRCRGFGPGDQHQGTGLGNCGEARRQADRIPRFGSAAADPQQRPLVPGEVGERLIGRQTSSAGRFSAAR